MTDEMKTNNNTDGPIAYGSTPSQSTAARMARRERQIGIEGQKRTSQSRTTSGHRARALAGSFVHCCLVRDWRRRRVIRTKCQSLSAMSFSAAPERTRDDDFGHNVRLCQTRSAFLFLAATCRNLNRAISPLTHLPRARSRRSDCSERPRVSSRTRSQRLVYCMRVCMKQSGYN